MDLQNIYNANKKTIIGSQNEFIKSYQKKLIKDYKISPKVIRSNESLKHIDPNIVNTINYFLNSSQSKTNYKKNNSEKESNIIIKDGLNYYLNNVNSDNFSFKKINEDEVLIYNKIKKYENTFINDYIVNINSIFLNSGFNLILKKNKEEQIHLDHLIENEKSTIYSKNFYKIEKDSKLLIIERFNNSVKSNINLTNYFEIGDGAEVTHLVIQNNAINANLQFTSQIDCNPSSKFEQFIFNISKGSIRNHHYADLNGQNITMNLHGVFFASQNQVVDNKTLVNHLHPDCSSNQTYKAILTDQSKASYLSKTFVDKKAQKTEGYQLSKGIILSDKATFHSKPELRIYADDVKCSHGSTIGPIDRDMLFYLRTRGLNNNESIYLLLKSFYFDFFKNINDENFKNELNNLADNWLKENIK